MLKTYVPPDGPTTAKLAICGEQPGLTEVRWKPRPKPFVGPAGQALDECLSIAGLHRFDLWMTNVIKDLDAPLGKYITIKSNGKSFITDEGWQYINRLGKELSEMPNLNAVVACGNIALLALTNRIGITNWRGSVLESTIVPGLKVIPTFHPATFIPPKFNFTNKPLICFDLQRAKDESEFREIRRKQRSIKVKPSFAESMSTLKYIHTEGRAGAIIDIDIEVINEELDCIAFAWNDNQAICIPFRDHNGDYFNIEQEYEIMLAIAGIIEDDLISKRGANFIFDTQYLLHKYGIKPRGTLHCTQIAQKIAFPDFKAGLNFVTSMHTDIPYYKADGKKWMKMGTGSWETWWNYNGMDTISTAAAHPSQLEDLRRQGNIETYERQRKLLPPLIYMMERGIRVDVDGMVKEANKVDQETSRLTEELHKKVGYEINHNSPKQLADYFYGKLGIAPYKKRTAKGSAITTDVDAMKRIARRGYQEARIILDLRSLTKRKSVYLDVSKVDIDGRYHSSYKPVGAETGRLSSGETIFGTGGNQQNWPHDLLRYFIADEGCIIYSIDMSQIENRLVAYVGGVIPMIKAFEDGLDVHTLTASLILSKPYDQISKQDGSCDFGDGRQSERYWGKKANHGLNYDLGYKSFAIKYEMTEKEAKYIVERYHLAYPGVRQGYHAMIRNQLINTRTITNLFGRKRVFLGPIVPNKTTPRSACENTYKEAYAHLPQSTTADKINEHGIEHIYYNQDQFKVVDLLTQIHDSVVFQIPLSVPVYEHARVLSLIKARLETPMYWHEREITIPADISIGLNMCKDDMIELKSKDVPFTLPLFTERLSSIHDKLRARTT